MKKKDFKPCIFCGKGMMHDGNILFFKVSIQRMGINMNAVKEQHGLEIMLGSPAIASVMGPDSDIAKPIGIQAKGLICDTCACDKKTVLAQMAEMMNDED